MNNVKLPRKHISPTPADMFRQIIIHSGNGNKEDDKPFYDFVTDKILKKEYVEEKNWLKKNKIKAEFLCYDTYMLVKFNSATDATAFKLRWL